MFVGPLAPGTEVITDLAPALDAEVCLGGDGFAPVLGEFVGAGGAQACLGGGVVVLFLEGLVWRGCGRQYPGVSSFDVADGCQLAFRPCGVVVEEVRVEWFVLCVGLDLHSLVVQDDSALRLGGCEVDVFGVVHDLSELARLYL